MEFPKILDDKRSVFALTNRDGAPIFQIGQQSVTEIAAYGEPGPYCELPFFAVLKGEEVAARVPAEAVMAIYLPREV